MSTDNRADVVVIGSGAGGAPAAWSLADSGAHVVLLEKGPHYGPADFVHDEVAVARRNFFVPYDDDDPHTIRKDGAAQATRTREGWIGINVGGGTVRMAGFCYRLHAEDFELHKRLGNIAGASIADWPITLADLQPHYD